TLVANDCQPGPASATSPARVSVGDREIWFHDLPRYEPPVAHPVAEAADVPDDGLALERDDCGATLSQLYDVTHVDSQDIDLRRTKTWSGTAAIEPGCLGAPSADCSFVEDFHFTLLQPCRLPCAL